MKKHLEELDRLRFYMHYFITMVALNSQIPVGVGVSKHIIKSFENFKDEAPKIDAPNYPYKSNLHEFMVKFPKCDFK